MALAPVVIRAYRDSDHDSVAALWSAVFLVAGYDGVRGWIYHLAVDPVKRRSGIARRLMQAAEQALEALGCPKINLQIRANNTAVGEFYRTLGYRAEDNIPMAKPLGRYRTR